MNETELLNQIHTYLSNKFSKRTIELNNADEISPENSTVSVNGRDYKFYDSARVETFIPNIRMTNDFGIAYYFFLMQTPTSTTQDASPPVIESLKNKLNTTFKGYGYNFNFLGNAFTKNDYSVILYVDKNSITHFLDTVKADSSVNFEPPF